MRLQAAKPTARAWLQFRSQPLPGPKPVNCILIWLDRGPRIETFDPEAGCAVRDPRKFSDDSHGGDRDALLRGGAGLAKAADKFTVIPDPSATRIRTTAAAITIS